MTIIITKNMSYKLKGEISKFLFEPRKGLFVGEISKRVRDLLWDKIIKEINENKESAILIYSSKLEQKFSIEQCGKEITEFIDLDNIKFFRRKII